MTAAVRIHGPIETYREPPHSIETEQGLLGAMILNNSVFETVGGLVKTEDFHQEVHKRIFDVVSGLIGSKQAASPATLLPFLGNPELIPGVCMSAYLARLCAEAVPSLIARDYATTIRDLSIRRSIISAAREIADQAHDLPVSVRPTQLVGEAVSTFHTIGGQANTGTTRRDAGASALEAFSHIQAIKSGMKPAARVSTGFPELDDATEGFQPGTLWVVAARPGMGKTIVAATSANKVAKSSSGVMLFSLEVPEEQMRARILSDLAFDRRQPISFKAVMSGLVDDTALWLLEDACERLAVMPLVLDVASRLTPAEIRMRVRAEKERMAAKGISLRVIFIDYLKQIQASDRYRGNRVYEVGEITYSLKQLAKDEGVCIVLLAQLNRANEGRDDKRPGLADLRESGDLESDADVVAFVHREAYYIQRSQEYRAGDIDAQAKFFDCEHKAELILGKNRIGPTKTIELWCDVACSHMSSAA